MNTSVKLETGPPILIFQPSENSRAWHQKLLQPLLTSLAIRLQFSEQALFLFSSCFCSTVPYLSPLMKLITDNLCSEYVAPTLHSSYLPTIFASWEIRQNPVILNSAICSCIFHTEFCKPPWCLYQLGKTSLWRKAYNFASEKRYKRHFVGHTSSTVSPPFFSEFYKLCLLKTPKEN